MINKGFDDENNPIKGENENDFKKYMEYENCFLKLFFVLYDYQAKIFWK